jgi:putative tricarboxylic transport membrane protein
MLLVLNIPLIPMWVRVLKIPYVYLFPAILLFCLIGAYSFNNSTMDMFVMNTFGVLGYLMKKLKYEAAPLVLALVLGPMFENNVRLSLIISHGSFLIFLTRPIALVFFVVAFFLIISPFFISKRVQIASDE